MQALTLRIIRHIQKITEHFLAKEDSMRKHRSEHRFAVLTDEEGRVVGFSETIRIQGESNPLFTLWHNPEEGTWTAEIQNPRLRPETISATHLNQVAWKCGYTSDELVTVGRIFELNHPSRLDVAVILEIKKGHVSISSAPRRQ